jgi:hypothetical protein
MMMFLAGVAAVMGLSLLGFLFLLWRAPLLPQMPQPDDGFEPARHRSPSIDPA